jgi:hypothetical protein
MRRLLALPLILSLAFAAEANDTAEISLRTKALASASALSAPTFSTPGLSASRHADALLGSSRDPLPQLLMLDEQEGRGVRAACDTTARDFCYDLAERRVVYRGARQYMPSVAGLSPEGVALRHNRVVLTYSFK